MEKFSIFIPKKNFVTIDDFSNHYFEPKINYTNILEYIKAVETNPIVITIEMHEEVEFNGLGVYFIAVNGARAQLWIMIGE